MEQRNLNHVKLGIFVLAGLVFLVALLYMIGRNMSLFGSTYTLKARFENVQGLVAGNNVRYAGIQAGTVKAISVYNDTAMEVTMFIGKEFSNVIRKNAAVSIGTDGLVGNKVVNISPAKINGVPAIDGDVLPVKKSIDTDDMLETLYTTGHDLAAITSGLRMAVTRINENNNLWKMLSDPAIPRGVKISLGNIRTATEDVASMAADLNSIVADLKSGKGSAGAILRDSSLVVKLNQAIDGIAQAGHNADTLIGNVTHLFNNIGTDLNSGKGILSALLKDPLIPAKLNESLDNIQKGTEGFKQNMEALKHNFLFRGYFKNLEKEEKKRLGKQNIKP